MLSSLFEIDMQLLVLILDLSSAALGTTPERLLQAQQEKMQQAVQSGNLSVILHRFAVLDGAPGLITASGVTATVTSLLPTRYPSVAPVPEISPSTSSASGSNDGLSAGAIAGIIIGVVAFVSILLRLIRLAMSHLTYRSKVMRSLSDKEGGDNLETQDIDQNLESRDENHHEFRDFTLSVDSNQREFVDSKLFCGLSWMSSPEKLEVIDPKIIYSNIISRSSEEFLDLNQTLVELEKQLELSDDHAASSQRSDQG